LNKLNDYYKQSKKIDSVVRNDLVGDDEIVYGARSVNKILPSHLEKPTEDWDIYSKTPKAAAVEAERKLDRSFGDNYFETKKAIHPGTWKVTSKVTNRGVIDFTKRTKEIPYRTIGGIRYAKLSHTKENIKRALSEPESSYRHEKDKETRQRIAIYEKGLPKQEKRTNPKKFSLFSGKNLFG